MSIKKSDILNILAKNYPNFFRKDLKKLIEIFISESKNALKRGDRVEFRDVFTLDPRIQKEGIRRNPMTGEKNICKRKKKYTV